MASSTSSSSRNPTIPQEESKLYHTIDRNIFARLVLNLGRDPGESMHVMALFLWLENFSSHARNLDVCVRAFDDIMQQALGLTNALAADQERIEQNLEPLSFYGPLIRPILPVYNYYNSGVGDIGDQNMGNQQIFRSNSNTGDSSFFHGVYPDLSLRPERESLNNEMEELLNHIPIICINSLEKNNSNKEVAADDRTIFLTFSKGYPISEKEVTDFFTRKFGDNLVEGVEMQEIPEGEQPLYAKLVLNSDSDLEIVLKGKPKAKFSINGKHVWSRKFMRRNPKSPLTIFESDHLP
ncbi:hypothetical protein CRYUN_Cryun41cG0030900 [Craigia yunnanensis]